MTTTNPLEPEPVVNPLELSGGLAAVSIDSEQIGYLLYTVPANKKAVINIDACVRNTTGTDLTFYVGSGSSPAVTDMVKSTTSIPYDSADERKRTIKKSSMGIKQIMMSGGEKLWCTVKKSSST